MKELSEQEYSAYVAAMAVAILAITVLLFVVIMQNKKIREAQHPKFGFLGKPLTVFAVALIALSTLSLSYYTNNKDTEVDQISADTNVTIEISYQLVNPAKNEYKFNAIPIVDSRPWGDTDDYEFDIYWLFASENVTTEIEFDISRNNPGGITAILSTGENTINARIYIEDRIIEREIKINL